MLCSHNLQISLQMLLLQREKHLGEKTRQRAEVLDGSVVLPTRTQGVGRWSTKVRIAYTNLPCAECKKVIKIGHPYVWRERSVYFPGIGEVFSIERIHPECEEPIKTIPDEIFNLPVEDLD